jgi:putative flippase GtrA
MSKSPSRSRSSLLAKLRIPRLINNRREQKRFAKFAAVGLFGALVDYFVFNLLLNLAGLKPIVSQALSFSFAVTSNFLLNRYWTFPDSRSKHVAKQVGQYVLVNFIGLLIRTPIFNGLGTLFERALTGKPLPFSLSAYVAAHNLALGCAIGVVLFWNFFINRYWTYGDVE